MDFTPAHSHFSNARRAYVTQRRGQHSASGQHRRIKRKKKVDASSAEPTEIP